MKKIVLFIKGIVIGIATLVPGVSGGTMAIILGVYDKMISSVSSFFKHIKQNTIFLGILACGGVLGIGLFSRLIKFCLTEFKMPTIYLFLGIITGGIPLLYKKTNSAHNHKKNYIYFVIGLGLIIIMTFYKGTIINLAKSGGILNYLFLLLAGIIVAIALILPGISTSFMLLTLGLYDITINAINNLEYNFLIPFSVSLNLSSTPLIASASLISSTASSGIESSVTNFLSSSIRFIKSFVTAKEILKLVKLHSSNFTTANLNTSGW